MPKYELLNVLLRTALAGLAVFISPLKQSAPPRHSREGGNLDPELGAVTIAQLEIRHMNR